MQEHNINILRKLNQAELEIVTGGCSRCAGDRAIRNSAAKTVIAYQDAKALGFDHPQNVTKQIGKVIDQGTAAMKRIEERHPEIYKLGK
jgi:hypothetical protein